jgi:Tfp pilus assembly protein PilN
VRRPRKRWLEEVKQNLKQMGVRGWWRRTQNRDEWRRILKEAKVLHGPQHQGVSQSVRMKGEW